MALAKTWVSWNSRIPVYISSSKIGMDSGATCLSYLSLLEIECCILCVGFVLQEAEVAGDGRLDWHIYMYILESRWETPLCESRAMNNSPLQHRKAAQCHSLPEETGS